MNKKAVQVAAQIQFFNAQMKSSRERLRKDHEAFKNKHGQVIQQLIEMVEKPHFGTLPPSERANMVETLYNKIIIGEASKKER